MCHALVFLHAIMLNYKEFSCWIEIEGEEAKEYDTRQTENDKGIATVTCWIASEAGKVYRFKILVLFELIHYSNSP